MTRTDVCERLGVSPKSLYSWERQGKVAKPRRDYRGWRVYGPADVARLRRFLGRQAAAPAPAPRAESAAGSLSARNQLRGTVLSVRQSGILAEVVLCLEPGQEVVAVVTAESARRLGLAHGAEARAVIKATEVMVLR